MPTGNPTTDAMPISISVPRIAFAMPPPDSPTGFGMCVKKPIDNAPAPCFSRYARMTTSGTTASAAARHVSVTIRMLTPRRRASPRARGRA